MRWHDFYDRRKPVGENPPTGAIVYYYLPIVPKGVVTLEFVDASGKVLRRYSNEEKKEGEAPPEWLGGAPPDKTIPPAVVSHPLPRVFPIHHPPPLPERPSHILC